MYHKKFFNSFLGKASNSTREILGAERNQHKRFASKILTAGVSFSLAATMVLSTPTQQGSHTAFATLPPLPVYTITSPPCATIQRYTDKELEQLGI